MKNVIVQSVALIGGNYSTTLDLRRVCGLISTKKVTEVNYRSYFFLTKFFFWFKFTVFKILRSGKCNGDADKVTS